MVSLDRSPHAWRHLSWPLAGNELLPLTRCGFERGLAAFIIYGLAGHMQGSARPRHYRRPPRRALKCAVPASGTGLASHGA